MVVLLTAGAPDPGASAGALWRRGVLAATVLGLVNWLYDVAAIRAGILRVYNQPWADGRSPRAIVNDYAPWFFGGFGFIYGVGLALAESVLAVDAGRIRTAIFGAGLVAATVTLPTVGYVLQSYVRHGHHGCRPVLRGWGA
jgi:hypothetical protein